MIDSVSSFDSFFFQFQGSPAFRGRIWRLRADGGIDTLSLMYLVVQRAVIDVHRAEAFVYFHQRALTDSDSSEHNFRETWSIHLPHSLGPQRVTLLQKTVALVTSL